MRAQRVLLLWCRLIPNPVATGQGVLHRSVDPRPDLLYVSDWTRFMKALVVSRADRSDVRCSCGHVVTSELASRNELRPPTFVRYTGLTNRYRGEPHENNLYMQCTV